MPQTVFSAPLENIALFQRQPVALHVPLASILTTRVQQVVKLVIQGFTLALQLNHAPLVPKALIMTSLGRLDAIPVK
jgi:hypothetical protein